MLGRNSKLVLAVGFVVVLALAVGLAQLTRGAIPAQVTAHGPTASPQPPSAEPPASVLPSVVSEPTPVPAPPRQAATPVTRPELAPAPVSFAREMKRDANGKLVPIIPAKELRAQLYLTDAPMKTCIEQSGQRPTGKATLSFTVAAKNNKLVIETTGVHDDETLAGYPELLSCMHQTANVLSLEGRAVPELGTPIYVRRHVRIEDGVIAENSIFNFSYNP